jgi:PST family polysaccharide transporter
VNINVLLYEKDLNFRKIVFIETVPVLIGMAITIIMAINMKNAWALVYGQILSGLLRVFISYIYFPKLPTIKFQFSKFKELFVFGKWILIGGILSYVVMEGDKYFVGKFVGVASLGLYQVGYKYTNFILDTIKGVTGRVLFPSYSIIQNDKYRIKNAILRAYSSIFFILAPATSGIVLVSYDFSHFIAGEKWTGIYDVMFFLGIAAFIRSINVCSTGSFFGYGKPQIHTYMAFARLLVLSGTIWWLCFKFGVKGVCFSVIISNSVLAILTTYYLYNLFSISILDLIKHNITTLISLLFMVLVVECFKNFSTPSSTRFILCIIFGGSSYMLCYLMFIKFSNIFNPLSEILYAFKQWRVVIHTEI